MADGPFYTITHSKVQVFLQCKKRFWFQFASGLRWPEEAMNAPGIVGTGVHAGLRVLCETDDPDLGRAELDRYLRMPAHESAGEGTGPNELAFKLYDKGVDVHQSLGTPNSDRWAEKRSEFKYGPASLIVQSRIDRIDRIGPDRWQIIDWKTGLYDQDDVTDAQLDLAHLALRSSFKLLVKREHSVRALAVNLRGASLPRVRELRRDDAANTLRYYTNLAAQMRTNTDWTPTPGPFCRYCRWREQCPEGSQEDHADYLERYEDDDEDSESGVP